jgi:hypothetical protein
MSHPVLQLTDGLPVSVEEHDDVHEIAVYFHGEWMGLGAALERLEATLISETILPEPRQETP